jgi:hypothetical protein
MATWLKHNTAVSVKIGPFVDTVDGFTPQTGLVLTSSDIRLSKAGAAFFGKSDPNPAVHQENGWYSCPLGIVDTDTLGELIIAVNETSALPVWAEFFVVPDDMYDSFMGGTVIPSSLTTADELNAAQMISDLDAVLARRGENVTLRRTTTDSPKVNSDVTVKGHVRVVAADEVIGTIAQDDIRVIVSSSGLGPPEWVAEVPVIGDKVVLYGKSRDIKLVKPVRDAGVLVRIEMMVKG